MKHSLLTSFAAVLISSTLMADVPLKLELVAPEKPVSVDQATLEKAGPDSPGAEPSIELKYRITNKGESDIKLEHGGDATTNQLEIKGPGALNKPYEGLMTMEFRMGKPITIGAGESQEFTITGLKYGKRDLSHWIITKAGEYEVTLTHKTRAAGKPVVLKSNTAKFTVAAK